jgi:hypothetical protein
MKYNYAAGKLGAAVLYAMRSEESLPERLQGCFSIFHTLQDDYGYLPPELRQRFDAMIQAWTRVPNREGVRGTVAATADKMVDREALKWLEEILSLYTEVTELEAVRHEKALNACSKQTQRQAD